MKFDPILTSPTISQKEVSALAPFLREATAAPRLLSQDDARSLASIAFAANEPAVVAQISLLMRKPAGKLPAFQNEDGDDLALVFLDNLSPQWLEIGLSKMGVAHPEHLLTHALYLSCPLYAEVVVARLQPTMKEVVAAYRAVEDHRVPLNGSTITTARHLQAVFGDEYADLQRHLWGAEVANELPTVQSVEPTVFEDSRYQKPLSTWGVEYPITVPESLFKLAKLRHTSRAGADAIAGAAIRALTTETSLVDEGIIDTATFIDFWADDLPEKYRKSTVVDGLGLACFARPEAVLQAVREGWGDTDGAYCLTAKSVGSFDTSAVVGLMEAGKLNLAAITAGNVKPPHLTDHARYESFMREVPDEVSSRVEDSLAVARFLKENKA